MIEWEKCRLGDYINIDTGVAFKSIDYRTTGILKVIRGKNVKVGKLKWDCDTRYWDYSTIGLEKYFLIEGDIVIGMDGSKLGENRSQVKNCDLPAILAQRVARLRSIPNKINQNYIWHVIFSLPFQEYVKSIYTGTSIPHISQSQIADYEISLPPLPEQKAIASVLSCLDDKIDLLHRQNKTLEAMAETLFRQWFIEEAQEDWETVELGQFVEVMRGLSYKGSGLCSNDRGVPMHNLNSVYEGGGYKYEGIKYYSGDFKDRHLINPGDVIITNTEQGHDLLLIGFPAIVPRYFGNTGIFSQHIYKLRIKDKLISEPFLYFLIMNYGVREQITGATNGSTVNMLPKDGIEWAKFRLPPIDKIAKFTEIVESCLEKKELIHSQIRNLENIRDTLLPKLMSGEIRVAH